MVHSCNVCKRVDHLNPDLTFHRFPKDPERRNIWFELVGILESQPLPKYPELCSDHFRPEDLEVRSNGLTYVKKNANPRRSEGLLFFDDVCYCSSPDSFIFETPPKKKMRFKNTGDSSSATESAVEIIKTEELIHDTPSTSTLPPTDLRYVKGEKYMEPLPPPIEKETKVTVIIKKENDTFKRAFKSYVDEAQEAIDLLVVVKDENEVKSEISCTSETGCKLEVSEDVKPKCERSTCTCEAEGIDLFSIGSIITRPKVKSEDENSYSPCAISGQYLGPEGSYDNIAEEKINIGEIKLLSGDQGYLAPQLDDKQQFENILHDGLHDPETGQYVSLRESTIPLVDLKYSIRTLSAYNKEECNCPYCPHHSVQNYNYSPILSLQSVPYESAHLLSFTIHLDCKVLYGYIK